VLWLICTSLLCSSAAVNEKNSSKRGAFLMVKFLNAGSESDLVVPRTRLQLGNRALRVVGPVAWNSLPLHIRSEPIYMSKTCSSHIFSHVLYTPLTNCFAEYEQKTLYDALVVTLAMLLCLINRRLLLLLHYYYRNVSWTGNQTPIPADRAPAVAMIGWHVTRLLGCGARCLVCVNVQASNLAIGFPLLLEL